MAPRSNTSRFSPPRLVNLAGIAGLAAALVACSSPAATPPAEQSSPAVPTAAPSLGQDLVGVITTRRSAVVAAEFEARVQRILVTSGQRVRTGDPLVQLDDSQLRQRVEAAHHAVEAAYAKVMAAGAQVANAQRKLAIEQRLYQRGAQAREAVTSARFELSSAAASASAARAEHQSAMASRVELEQQLAKATLVAPMDGVVTVVKVKEGEIARSGTKIARVFDPQDLRVQFELPRMLRDELAIGSSVDVMVDGVTLRAPVVEISADLEPPLQFAIATADLVDDGGSQLARVGAEVRVKLAIGAGKPPAAQTAAAAPAPVAPAAPVAAAPVAAAPAYPAAPVAAAPAAAAPAYPAAPVAAAPAAAAPAYPAAPVAAAPVAAAPAYPAAPVAAAPAPAYPAAPVAAAPVAPAPAAPAPAYPAAPVAAAPTAPAAAPAYPAPAPQVAQAAPAQAAPAPPAVPLAPPPSAL